MRLDTHLPEPLTAGEVGEVDECINCDGKKWFVFVSVRVRVVVVGMLGGWLGALKEEQGGEVDWA